MYRQSILILLLFIFVQHLAVVNSFAQTTVTGTMTTNAVWKKQDSPYIVQNNLIIPKTITLTIEPGVVIKHDGNYIRDILTVNGSIIAQGTAEMPIIFTDYKDDVYGGDSNGDGSHSVPEKEDWKGINIATDAYAVFTHCTFRYGGYIDQGHAALTIASDSTFVQDNSFEHCGKAVTVVGDIEPQILDNAFIQNQFPLSLSLASNPVLDGNTLTSNEFDVINIEAIDYNNTGDVYTLTQRNFGGISNISYVAYKVHIDTGVKLIIDPGVVLKHQGNHFRNMFDVSGTIIAHGTDSQPIVFTSISDDEFGGDSNNDGANSSPEKEDWKGLALRAGATARISNCQFRFGGSTFQGVGSGCLTINAGDAIIDNCTFDQCGKAVTVVGAISPAIRYNTFSNNVFPIALSIDAVPIFEDNHLETTNDVIGVWLEPLDYEVSGSYTLEKISFAGYDDIAYITNELTIKPDVTLVIEPGVILKHSGYSFDNLMTIEGTLIAMGSTTEPVVFTDITDDAFGGDTNNDGTASSPNPGDWGSIFMSETSTGILSYCTFRYGGDEKRGSAAVTINGNDIIIRHNTFQNNEKALTINGLVSPIINHNLFQENKFPVGMSLGSDPQFDHNELMNNDINGIWLEPHDYDISGTNFTLKKLNFGGLNNPSFVTRELTIGPDVTLTIEPGIIIKHEGNPSRDLINVKGTLTAIGTQYEPIIFTDLADDTFGGDTNNDGQSSRAQTNDWRSIYLFPGSLSSFSHCFFRYGGRGNHGGIHAASTCSINHCRFYKNSTGLKMIEGGHSVLDSCRFEGNEYGIIKSGGSVLIRHSNLVDNTNQAIQNLTTVDISATHNWWGNESGPTHDDNPAGTGDSVTDFVLYNPIKTEYVLDSILPANHDLAIIDIDAPSSDCGFREEVSITITISNEGLLPQSNFLVGFEFDGELITEETVSHTIQPNEHYQFTFSETMDLTSLGLFSMSSYTSLETDERTYNDNFIKELSVFPILHTTITGESIICQGETLYLSADNGSTYLWNTGQGGATIELNPESNSTYSVTITNEFGCSAESSFDVEVLAAPSVPVISYSGSLSFCEGDSLHLTSTITENIVWSTGETTASIYVKETGQYTLQHTGSNGCVSTSDVLDIQVTTAPKIKKNGDPIVCLGESAELSIANSSDILWSTGATSASLIVSPITATQYHVTGNSNGCSFADTLQLDVISVDPPAPPSHLIPSDQTQLVQLPVNLSWQPSDYATHYDLYYWKHGYTKPPIPQKEDIQTIATFIQNINNKSTYQWQVIAKNTCHQIAGPLLEFSTDGLPDLTVSDLATAPHIAAGNQIQLNWKVSNIGDGSTGAKSWRERVYLSSDLDLRVGDDILLRTYNNDNFLAAGDSYQRTESVIIPQELLGTYYLFVIADHTDAYCTTKKCTLRGAHGGYRMKERDEQNNFIYDQITIYPAYGVDLQMGDIGAPTAAFGGDTISITYAVQNIGAADMKKTLRRDVAYLSRSPLTLLEQKKIASEKIDTSLLADDSMTHTLEAVIPLNAFGKYYIYVYADQDNDIYENRLEFNNINAAVDSIYVTLNPPSDLLPIELNAPSSFESGKSVFIDWKVKNQGLKSPYYKFWEDHIYISKEAIFNIDSSSLIGHIRQENGDTLNYDNSYGDTLRCYIPNGISGDYYVYVHTDAKNKIFEYNKEANNILRSENKVVINLPSFPDLTVTDIQAPESINSDQEFEIMWRIKNKGEADFSKTITDRIYVSETQDTIHGFGLLLAETSQPRHLLTGESYRDTVNVRVPLHMTNDPFYFHVVTDYENVVYEHHHENNNTDVHTTFGSDPTNLNELFSDLNINNFLAPASVYSGTPLHFSWSVVNHGDVRTTNDSWLDQVFLSEDTEFDLYEDYPLAKQIHTGPLEQNAFYGRSHQKLIPHGLEGDMYLILLIDKKEKLKNESNQSNNTKIIPIKILTPDQADLSVEHIDGPREAIAGSRISLSYTIKNKGDGVGRKTWADVIYISNSADLSERQNYQIGDSLKIAPLPIDTSYTESLDVIVPYWLEGNYYVVVKTGVGLYEGEGSENNTLAYPIHILPPPDSDLEISSTSLIDDHFYGDVVPMEYTIKNIGIDTATGFVRNAIHYSEDDLFKNNDDPLLNFIHEYVDIPPGDSITGTLKGVPTYIQPGEYHSVLRTNTKRRSLESNFENNQDISTETFNLDARSLTLDVVETATLSGSALFYKVTVEAGVDLLITQTSDTTGGYNEIIVAYERNPSLTDYDFINKELGIAHQLYIPNTKAGDYYIQIKSNNFIFPRQEISVLAQALPFSVIAVGPNVVGQGEVTTLIEGAGFEETDEVYLLNDGNQLIATGRITEFISRMQMRVQWNFSSVPLDTYDLVIEKPGNVTTVLTDAITIEEASPKELQIIDLTPNVFRLGKIGTIKFEFKNTSNVDIRFALGELILPKGIEIFNFEKSKNIISRSELESELELEDFLVHSEYTHLPLLISHLGVGQSYTISFNVKDYQRGFFQISGRFVPLTASEFLEATIEKSIQAREQIIANPESFGLTGATEYDEIISSKSDMIESLRQSMVDMGLFKDFETVDFLESCTLCSNFDFDIQNSPGIKDYNELNMAANKTMLWEINHPYGEAGGDKGWDFYNSLGSINVTATPENPFIIYISSRSSLDNSGHFLTTFSPGYDICWPFAFAENGITGFDPSNFVLDDELFRRHNPMYGGYFSIKMIDDTLFICFNAATPSIGQDGFPGNHGHASEDGGTGGPGGNGSVGTPAGNGGQGGNGGIGFHDGPGGNGGAGGPGGIGGPGGGGIGGIGGAGGIGSPPGSGGPGGIGSGGVGSSGSPGSSPSNSDGPPLANNSCLSGENPICPKTPFRALGCLATTKLIIGLIAGGPLTPLILANAALSSLACATGNPVLTAAACVTGSVFACASTACKLVEIVASCDPNEIQGPSGIGPERWVSDNEELPYTILFENDPTFASAAAQRVVIRQTLDESLDASTFRLGDFEFGPFHIEVPPNRLTYSKTLDLPDSIGIDVEVTAGLDITDHSIFWIFQSINPETGLPPIDPFEGFLPVNDTLSRDGEGYVNYSISPKPNTQTGTVINAQANIFFDTNPPIQTNHTFNTVDSDEPSSHISSASISGDNMTIQLNIESQDDSEGSGVKHWDIYVSHNEGPYKLLINDLDTDSYSFIGEANSQYAFYSIATDLVGNIENSPALPDILINLNGLPICNIPLEYVLDVDTIPGGTVLAFDNVSFNSGLLKAHDSLIVRAREFISFGAGFETQQGSYLDISIGDCLYVPATPSFSYHNELVARGKKANEFLTEVQFRMSHNSLRQKVALEYYMPVDQTINLYLENAYGERVLLIEEDKLASKGMSRQVFMTDSLHAGIYFLNMETKDQQYRKKLFIH